ncbi:response regulator [Thalassotalea atypica]|uniref:response regulator n=1 Tax=Thalassotalea atypica TaxID=2054316 RepID=UPI0025740116|nr:response regulator [Thalassotalea atypica]
MTAIDYRDKRFLIVDSLKPSRDILKNLAFNLNPADVQASSYASDVLTKCAEQNFDIILLGYDLGEKQKNGQQLLEELRSEKLINRNTIVILVTGELSQAMVLAALEHKPDDYLTKPYTIRELSKRLHRCFVKRKIMSDIYTALDEEQSDQVIKLCDQAIQDGSPYTTECYGIKSRQHFNLEQYDIATDIYRAHRNISNCQWATMGLGKIALKKNKPLVAIEYFSQLKRKYPIYLSSYDWLATAQEEILQFIAAEETLEEAITISPLSVKRVQRYANLCLKNGHFDKATSAFEQNYLLSYNSIHHKPENALKFAYAATEYSHDLTDFQRKTLKNKVFSALAETVKTFDKMPTRLQSQLLTVDLMRKTNEVDFANKLLESTEKLLNKTQNDLKPEDGIEIAKLLIHLDRRPPANTLINDIVQNHHDRPGLMTEIDKLVDENHENRAQKEAQAALDRALTFYHNQEYNKSIIKLEEVRKLYPQHLGIQLNLIQVLLTYFEQDTSKVSLMRKAGALLNRIDGLSTGNGAFQRQKALELKFQRLSKLINS